MLHLAVFPTLSWCSATRYHEFPEARTVKLRMCTRALQVWPQVDEYVPTFFRRIARLGDCVKQPARFPIWDSAVMSAWWRWAGRIARLVARDQNIALDGASLERFSIMLLGRASDPCRSRLGTNRVGRPVTRWEDHIQRACSALSSTLMPWQPIAQDNIALDAMEADSAQRHTRPSRRPNAVPHGRWMIGETPT